MAARPLRIVAAIATLAAVMGGLGASSAEAQAPTFYTYIPSGDVTDGRMIAQAGTGLDTLVAVGTEFGIEVDGSETSWELGIFDGDTGKDINGNLTTSFTADAHWDFNRGDLVQIRYQLWADPDGTVDTATTVPTYDWSGNDPVMAYPGVTTSALDMPDNDWFDINLPSDPAAFDATSGKFRYRFRAELEDPTGMVESSFKLRATGLFFVVPFRPFQLVNPGRMLNDFSTVYPAWPATTPSNYNGTWDLFVFNDEVTDRIDMWDGDWDHGSHDGSTVDSNDPDTVGIPPFVDTGVAVNPEGAVGIGSPPDDSQFAALAHSPSIRYELTDTMGNVYPNDNPSGNREWEKFTIATAGCACSMDIDHQLPEIPVGFYKMQIQGYDIANINALRLPKFAFITDLYGDASYGDTVWFDGDRDGIFEPGAGELGIEGVSITLYRDIDLDGVIVPGEPVVGTDVTDASGNYLITGLADGQYIAIVDDNNFAVGGALEGLAQSTTAVSQTADGTNKVMPYISQIMNEQDNLTGDFGYFEPFGGGSTSIGNQVWLDLDNDGVFETEEAGVAGVELQLYWDANGDGLLDAGDLAGPTTTTDASGTYNFSGLGDGKYLVVVTDANYGSGAVLDGYRSAMTATGADDVNRGIENPYAVMIMNNTSDFSADFAVLPPPDATLGDRVWWDLDSDGVQDADETGINGVVVTLEITDSTGAVIETRQTTTSGDGDYLFTDLPYSDTETYTYAVDVDETTLPDAAATITFDWDNGTTSPDGMSAPTTNDLDSVTMTNLDQDFGYLPSGQIGDTVWWDFDSNGVQAAMDEPGIAGVEVTLTMAQSCGESLDVLFVVGNLTLNAGDQAVVDRLTSQGHTVTLVDDTASQTSDATGRDMVIVSSTVTAAAVGTKFRDVAVPVITWESLLYDDFNMTGSLSNTDFGGQGSQDSLDIADALSPLAAGLSGTVTVATAQTMFSWGVPGSEAEVAATVTGNGGRALIFGYEAGETMVNLTAPSRRVGFFMRNDTADVLNADGLALLDAAVSYAIACDLVQPLVLTTTTDASGNYLFENLPPGDYTITVNTQTLPDTAGVNTYDFDDGTTAPNSESLTTLAVAGSDLNQDFGYLPTGTIGDTVWYDLNADGVQQSTEVGIPGVTVMMYVDLNGDGRPDAKFATTTDADGIYLFENLPLGDFTVMVSAGTLPGGVTQTYDFDGTATPNTSLTSLTVGDLEDLDQDFGYRGLGSLGDYVWFDNNNNGLQDDGPDAGLSGVVVELYVDLDGDGTAETLLDTTITDADGLYLFENLTAGTYEARVVATTLPGGLTPTFDLDGTATVNTAVAVLGASQTRLDVDFGYYVNDAGGASGGLGDFVWEDLDGDGLQDAGEPGITGVVVNLYGDIDNDGVNEIVKQTTTSAVPGLEGLYGFDQLPAGEYTVELDASNFNAFGGALVAYTPTVQNVSNNGNDTADSDGDPDTHDVTGIALGASEFDLTIDFGFIVPASIGNTVWFDTDQDGFYEPADGELGIDGVLVRLTADLDGDGFLDVDLTQETAGGGQYLFGGLLPGDYTVTVLDSNFNANGSLAGYSSTLDQSASATDGADRSTPWTVSLDSGDNYVLADFGYVETTTPGGGQGCTPGYWRQPHHEFAWTTYATTDLFNDVFSLTAGSDYPGNPTLLDAVGQGGGGYKALGRHAVAALLNASNPDVSYEYSTSEVITIVQDAFNTGSFETAKNLLAGENEMGCPLGNENGGGGAPPPPPGGGGPDCDNLDVLFVGSDEPLLYSDELASKAVLEDAGHTVTVIDDNDVALSDAESHDVVYISSGVNELVLGDTLRDASTGIVVGELGLLDDMKMVANGDFGYLSNKDTVGIVDSAHPMAAGLDGSVKVLTSKRSMAYANPGAEAQIIAEAANVAGKAGLWVYESGANMVGLAAPGRRVGTFEADWHADYWNADAESLFLESIAWAAECTGGPPPPPSGECRECNGKATQLTLQYNGALNATVRVEQRDGQAVFDDTVAAGGEFTFSGLDKWGTLGVEISIYVDGVLNAEIHTSCSVEIGLGLIAGDFEVTEGYSRNGGLMCPIAGTGGGTPPPPPPPSVGGTEGCTPGYWKQKHHFDSWNYYMTGDSFDSTFGVTSAAGKDLLGALKTGGGGAKALGRHAVAALLNTARTDVDYSFDTNAVIDLVQDAYVTGDFEAAKNSLATENEKGCPLN